MKEKEWRPRLTKGELEFLIRTLRDRERALNEYYARLVRTVVMAATKNDSEETVGWTWSDAVFHNYDRLGKEALTFFRSEKHWRNRALDEELRKHETTLDCLDTQLLVTKGLRHRLEKLLNGKKKGRLDTASDTARLFLGDVES